MRLKLIITVYIIAAVMIVTIPMAARRMLDEACGGASLNIAAAATEYMEVIMIKDTAGDDTGRNGTEDVTDTDNSAMPDNVITVSVYLSDTGKVIEMELDEYILGVVMAEMPYTFNMEAIKAQAVAARSYCLYQIMYGKGYNGADVSTDYTQCAAYISAEDAVGRWGTDAANQILSIIKTAVDETAGKVVTYNGKPAAALFHARSYLNTESAENVWGNAIPYLVSVPTPEEDYITEFSISEEELKKIFSEYGETSLTRISRTNTFNVTPNSSGRAGKIYFNGSVIEATVLRTQLGLKSCRFEITLAAGGLKFTVHGNGHGVGMSQYGANKLAEQGYGYEEILKHYYTGITMGKVSDFLN